VKPETRAQLEARLKFYRDIGISAFYRDRATANASSPAVSPKAPSGIVSAAPDRAPGIPKPGSVLKPEAGAASTQSAGQRPALTLPVVHSPGLFDAASKIENDTLERIAADIGPDCTRCKLHRRRNKIVFGVGNPKARLVFVGEGPGADEDAQGIPFVGRAGQLLTQMIEAMGLKRDDVYICNVVKCRPPENRTPEPDEIETCSPYLLRQLEVIKPQVIVCLGAVAAKALLGVNTSMGKLRQQWFEFRSARLLATYHPAYCLRNPPSKADVWKDLQMAMVELGLPIPQRKK
jgi:uracil-DNA glycosylase family 4